ncbi:MAG: acireductone synthase [Proteobacteria bacterium]|nr:MAG: acireductone synthase [Pseudomonadota bacterium]
MISCVLTDIEGTTSSIEFVHKVLFPYSRANFFRFLSENNQSDVLKIVDQIWTEDLGQPKGSKPDAAQVTQLLQKWIDEDLKKASLKELQGMIWKEGFEAKAYLGHVYPEVKEELEKWKKSGLVLAVYSSGSVQAQKLLFKHSEAGDLTPLFAANFDTAVGHKREAESYTNIAVKLGLDAANILFLSDIKEELDAAENAGMKTCQLMRDPKPAQGHHPLALDFKEVTNLFLGE